MPWRGVWRSRLKKIKFYWKRCFQNKYFCSALFIQTESFNNSGETIDEMFICVAKKYVCQKCVWPSVLGTLTVIWDIIFCVKLKKHALMFQFPSFRKMSSSCDWKLFYVVLNGSKIDLRVNKSPVIFPWRCWQQSLLSTTTDCHASWAIYCPASRFHVFRICLHKSIHELH